MNTSEDFLLLLVHTHVFAATKVMQSINPTESIADLAKMIVVNYVWLPKIDDEDAESVMMGSIYMPLSYFHLGYCGMDFMMPFGKGTEKEYCATGSFCWFSLNQLTTEIMQKKQ